MVQVELAQLELDRVAIAAGRSRGVGGKPVSAAKVYAFSLGTLIRGVTAPSDTVSSVLPLTS
jgi:hypothetical protein